MYEDTPSIDIERMRTQYEQSCTNSAAQFDEKEFEVQRRQHQSPETKAHSNVFDQKVHKNNLTIDIDKIAPY